MVILYKNGKSSPPLFEVDARGWIAAGWSLQDSGAKKTPEPKPAKPVKDSVDVSAYLLKVWESDGWLPIKEIALSLNIEKPSDGWDKAIPLIVKKGWEPIN